MKILEESKISCIKHIICIVLLIHIVITQCPLCLSRVAIIFQQNVKIFSIGIKIIQSPTGYTIMYNIGQIGSKSEME